MRALAQVAVLSLLYVGFEWIALRLHSPIPGSVIGAIVLAGLLLTNVLPLRFFEAGAKTLLDHLSLFFVPAAVVAARSCGAVRSQLVSVTLIAVSTTVFVLLVTGRIAERGE